MAEFAGNSIYWLFWALILLCYAWLLMHHKKRIQAFLLGSVTGILSLILLHCFGETIGFAPTLSAANLTLSGVLGVPGTLLLTAAHFLT